MLSRRKQWRLKKQVIEGKCILSLSGSNEIERWVAVAALRITRHDGQILVRLGASDHLEERWVPSCVLPGAKQGGDELPFQTVQRLLAGELSFLSENVQIQHSHFETITEVSSSYKLKTKYLRTTYSAVLLHPFFPSRMVRPRADLGNVTLHEEVQTWLQQDVFTSIQPTSDDTFHLYTWLTADDFDLLSSSKGQALLEQWLSHLGQSEQHKDVI